MEEALAREHPGAATIDGAAGAGSRLAAVLPAELKLGVSPPTGGNHLGLLSDTRSVQDLWWRLLEDAKQHVHVVFFAWHDDETGRAFRDLLEKKAGEGVVIRVLYDAMGCRELPRRFFDRLRARGGQAAAFLPVRLLAFTPLLNFRNHRKLVIVDGRRAYTGGVNVTDEYLEWEDIGVEIEGPAVNALQEVFVDDWHFATSEELTASSYFPRVVPSGDRDANAVCRVVASGPDQVFNATRDMLFLAISQTRERLWIATPYFIPGDALIMALRTMVYRGIDLRIFVPGKSDSPIVQRASRAYYDELIQSGVAIYEYDGMLHAKAFLFDDDVTMIGSANLDIRSVRLNFELSMLIESRQLGHELANWFDVIGRRSTRIGREHLARRSRINRLGDAVAHILSPLL